jgi:hypothetical protein
MLLLADDASPQESWERPVLQAAAGGVDVPRVPSVMHKTLLLCHSAAGGLLFAIQLTWVGCPA